MNLLVTGGAGYVGSVVANQLLAAGHDVTILDNLSRGHREAVPPGATLLEVDLTDAAATRDALAAGYDAHLIPLVLQVAAGRRPHVQVFGTDYPTPDGTAVRDYIHIEDLGHAHLLAIAATEPGRHRIFNLGNGTGYSVNQVINTAAASLTGPVPSGGVVIECGLWPPSPTTPRSRLASRSGRVLLPRRERLRRCRASARGAPVKVNWPAVGPRTGQGRGVGTRASSSPGQPATVAQGGLSERAKGRFGRTRLERFPRTARSPPSVP
jgi:nucleoside-diphosphate-sugar epimerase